MLKTRAVKVSIDAAIVERMARAPSGDTRDVTPPDFNVRTRVHEYGGGAYTVHDGSIFFANFSDQRIYQQEAGSAPQPITSVAMTSASGDRSAASYADFRVDAIARLGVTRGADLFGVIQYAGTSSYTLRVSRNF